MDSTQAPSVSKDSILVVTWTLCGAAVALFIARLAIRKKFTARLWLDDWFAGAALGFLFAESLLTTLMANSMYETLRITQDTTNSTQIPDSTGDGEALPAFVESYMKMQFAQMICFWTCIWLVKASFLTLSYRLLPKHLRSYTVSWSILAGFTTLFFVLSIITYPIACNSLAPPYCSGQHSINLSHVSLRISTAFDIITDVCIIALPIALAWRIQLPSQTKITLVVIFSLKILMIIFSSLRLRFADTDGSRWPEVTALSLWSVIESGIAILVVNLVEFKLLFSINLSNTASTTYPHHEKRRSSTLPPTLRTSVISPPAMRSTPIRNSTAIPNLHPALNSHPNVIATTLPPATSAQPARRSIARRSVPAYRPSGLVVPYTPDPVPTTYSPPAFNDVSDPRLQAQFGAISPSSDRTPTRRWSDPSSHHGMEEIMISHDLDNLHAEILARDDLPAMNPSSRNEVSAGAYESPQPVQGDRITTAGDATENELVIQGEREDDDPDAGLEGYDLGGLSYYLPETPEAHRTSFYNL